MYVANVVATAAINAPEPSSAIAALLSAVVDLRRRPTVDAKRVLPMRELEALWNNMLAGLSDHLAVRWMEQDCEVRYKVD